MAILVDFMSLLMHWVIFPFQAYCYGYYLNSLRQWPSIIEFFGALKYMKTFG